MSKQSQYEWNQERDYQRELTDADFEFWLDDLAEDDRVDFERRLEEAAGY
uniref:Uncharacterized protein n=1 Tax=viral metagenome TaxID=1070528 RepID=A0A6M3LX49_9ZZZZ